MRTYMRFLVVLSIVLLLPTVVYSDDIPVSFATEKPKERRPVKTVKRQPPSSVVVDAKWRRQEARAELRKLMGARDREEARKNHVYGLSSKDAVSGRIDDHLKAFDVLAKEAKALIDNWDQELRPDATKGNLLGRMGVLLSYIRNEFDLANGDQKRRIRGWKTSARSIMGGIDGKVKANGEPATAYVVVTSARGYKEGQMAEQGKFLLLSLTPGKYDIVTTIDRSRSMNTNASVKATENTPVLVDFGGARNR